MSHTYRIVCHETKQKLWIGQGFVGMTTFYTGEQIVMEKLRRFLIATKGKPLMLMCTDTDDGEWHDYEEFE